MVLLISCLKNNWKHVSIRDMDTFNSSGNVACVKS